MGRVGNKEGGAQRTTFAALVLTAVLRDRPQGDATPVSQSSELGW